MLPFNVVNLLHNLGSALRLSFTYFSLSLLPPSDVEGITENNHNNAHSDASVFQGGGKDG